MPFTEDFDAFFSADEHATKITVDGQSVSAIVDRAYAEVFGLQSVEPMLTMAEASATALGLVEGSAVVVPVGQPAAGSYTVRELHPDGTGVLIVLLQVDS